MRSPDGRYEIVKSSRSDQSAGTPGMGHDMDDYFDVSVSLTVREVATGKIVLARSWSAGYDADSGTPAWLPSFRFSDDSRAVIARWSDGSEERLEL
jgi:hypothetical protein